MSKGHRLLGECDGQAALAQRLGKALAARVTAREHGDGQALAAVELQLLDQQRVLALQVGGLAGLDGAQRAQAHVGKPHLQHAQDRAATLFQHAGDAVPALHQALLAGEALAALQRALQTGGELQPHVLRALLYAGVLVQHDQLRVEIVAEIGGVFI